MSDCGRNIILNESNKKKSTNLCDKLDIGNDMGEAFAEVSLFPFLLFRIFATIQDFLPAKNERTF
jgi:hypothetical protein